MVVETEKESININKLVATKKEFILVEGDMIVPDSKPDILNTICTSGMVCIYKKEVSTDKVKIDGNINAYIMYLSEDAQDRVRGINTSLDFSESITVPNVQEGMECQLEATLSRMECKVINERKIGIKANLEVQMKIYSNEVVEMVNNIANADEIQILKEYLILNSLVGTGSTRIDAKETIAINNIDNLAEILKVNMDIGNKDIKMSYNKILTKAEANVKILYLTEDNRINSVHAKIPIVGFIDIPDVNESNICDVTYEIRNVILKPNPIEEHSIYIEIQVGVSSVVYEEKQIQMIQDFYSPCENLTCNKKQITTITGKQNRKEMKQIREKVRLDGIENQSMVDVDIVPNITKETALDSKMIYEGEIQLRFMFIDATLQISNKEATIPFEFVVDGLEGGENRNTNTRYEILNQDFIIQNGGEIATNIDMLMDIDSYQDTRLSVMDEIQSEGEREAQDYSIILYIVKKGDTLWNIAKEFGSTIDDIVRANGIEDPNVIMPGQKLFIPRYVKVSVSSRETPMISNA